MSAALAALLACSAVPGSSPGIARAEIDALRFMPRAGATITPDTLVSAFFDYRIATDQPKPTQGTASPYYAVLEARSADARRVFIDACGDEGRRALESSSGRVALSCTFNHDHSGSDDEELVLQVRIYQRTDARRSITIASSEPVSMRRRQPIFTPLERMMMPQCNPRKDRRDPKRATVSVCRG